MRIPLITRKLIAIVFDFLADPSTKGENNDQSFLYHDTLVAGSLMLFAICESSRYGISR